MTEGQTMRIFVQALLLCSLASAPVVSSAAPGDRGKRLFIQCQACHSMAAGAPHKVGPNLHGTINARAASRPGYAYSPALAKSRLIWDDKTLDRWLLKPSAMVPGNKMVFTGMANAKDRQEIIAYMKKAAR
jgi:cytochrome c